MPSQTGVDLQTRSGSEPGLPRSTILFSLRQIHALLDLRSSLEELNTETLSNMPSNMTMHQPCAGVIRDECNDYPSIKGQHCDISPCRVIEVKVFDVIVAEDLSSGRVRGGAEVVEIVPV